MTAGFVKLASEMADLGDFGCEPSMWTLFLWRTLSVQQKEWDKGCIRVKE